MRDSSSILNFQSGFGTGAQYVGYSTMGRAFTGTNPMRAQTQAGGTFRPDWQQSSPIREIQASIAHALKAQYEPPQFVPEPLARLLAQLVRGEGEG